MKNAYALAIIVRRRPPASSQVGDRAIIHADGRMDGFIGGSCSRDIVRKAALEALRSGEPQLLSLDPMACSSEGAIEVYIEPELPQPYFFVAGFTPVARAVARIAPKLDFSVVEFVRGDELPDAQPAPDARVMDIGEIDEFLAAIDPEVRARSAAVAAAQGHYDDTALKAFLHAGVGYTGLVASAKRGQSVMELLAGQGVALSDLERVRCPAGLDIGARAPADVAVSIFAQVIATRPVPVETHAETAVDPVCGMIVNVAETQDRAEFHGTLYYFCGSHCCAAFAAEPETYAGAVARTL